MRTRQRKKGLCQCPGRCAPSRLLRTMYLLRSLCTLPGGIDIAMVNKLYDLAEMQEEVPATLRAHYEQLTANADDCIACGGCEERCPFGVPVVQRMEKTKERFGLL